MTLYTRLTHALAWIFIAVIAIGACQDRPVNRSFTNEAGPEHQAVIGTKVSLVPPPEFVTSANFAGFEQEATGSSIMVMDVPGDFTTLRNAFTPEVMRTQGLEMKQSEYLEINGREAFLVDAEQTAYGMVFNKCVLGLNTQDGVVMINGVYPRELSVDLGDHIRAAIMSVVYEPQRSVNPLDALLFTIDAEGSKLQLVNVMANTMMFTTDGEAPTRSEDKTALMVGSAISEVVANNRQEFAELRLRQMPTLSDVNIEQTNKITVDSLAGIEIVAYGMDSKSQRPKMIFQTMLFGDNLYFLIVGTTLDDFDGNLAFFREITATFRRK